MSSICCCGKNSGCYDNSINITFNCLPFYFLQTRLRTQRRLLVLTRLNSLTDISVTAALRDANALVLKILCVHVKVATNATTCVVFLKSMFNLSTKIGTSSKLKMYTSAIQIF